MGEGGEIFILDMGTQIKIADMARDLIRLSGLEPDVDVKIEYIGLRPGEKLYEELITDGEDVLPTSHKKIMVLKGLSCHLGHLNGSIDELATLAYEQDEQGIREGLEKIVPDYKPALHGKVVPIKQRSRKTAVTSQGYSVQSHPLSCSPPQDTKS
jgi:FlaA1/EpsC-like NDP-sugar epimerase